MRLLLAVIVVLGRPHIGQAETFFVNNIAGSNTNSGLIDDNQGDGVGPLRTIAAALKLAQRGDRIVLANTGADYEECITLQGAKHSGYEYAPFIIDGNGAMLDGTAPVPPDQWDVVDENIYRFVPERGGFQQLFLDGKLAEQLPRFDGADLSTYLLPRQWCRGGGGINFAVEQGKTPNSYDLRYAKHRVGITLYDVQGVVIRNLKVRGFQLDGINAHDNAWECVLSGVVCSENGRSGISIGGASRMRILDSELRDNGQVQFNAEGWSTTSLYRTRMISNDAPVWYRWTNEYAQGARVSIDDLVQTNTTGWMTNEDKVWEELQRLEKAKELPPDVDQRMAEDKAAAKDSSPAKDQDDASAVFEPDQLDEAAEEQMPADENPFADDPFGDVEIEDGGSNPGNASDAGDLFDGADEAIEDDPFGDEN